MSVLTILKVIGRVFLIGIGLLFIAGGGLCVMFGTVNTGGGGMALIGMASLLLGVAGVWWILRNWMRERPETEGEDAH
ncbi:hypothetical protein LZ012_04245 [Dechloromonas sp. XY25]|uniref:Uncharacterized protein n=1 Tax=Dechloromonas hankyongensis TaxID=2908002 RepID=A0ABS9JZ70_9RHOO|nr:hypothetical protein [Dechloromonas hankyongensis]MCG2576202.1 hypothetical protein [Dechloromonas hankyongensis]